MWKIHNLSLSLQHRKNIYFDICVSIHVRVRVCELYSSEIVKTFVQSLLDDLDFHSFSRAIRRIFSVQIFHAIESGVKALSFYIMYPLQTIRNEIEVTSECLRCVCGCGCVDFMQFSISRWKFRLICMTAGFLSSISISKLIKYPTKKTPSTERVKATYSKTFESWL